MRLLSLTRLMILDSDYEETFDRITKLTQKLLDTPIVLVSLVDKNRQWFKSCLGLAEILGVPEARETPRDQAFCAHAILSDETLVVSDALLDERFKYSPLVLGPPFIRFYAGVSLKMNDGYRLGTLCIIDQKPRSFTKADDLILRDMAQIVVRELENRLMARYMLSLGRIGEQALARHALANLVFTCIKEIQTEFVADRVELFEHIPVCPQCFRCEACGVSHVFRVCQLRGKGPFREGEFVADCFAWKTLQEAATPLTFSDMSQSSKLPFPTPYLRRIRDPSVLHFEESHAKKANQFRIEAAAAPNGIMGTSSKNSPTPLSNLSLYASVKSPGAAPRRITSTPLANGGRGLEQMNLHQLLSDISPRQLYPKVRDGGDSKRSPSEFRNSRAEFCEEEPMACLSVSVNTTKANKCVLRAFTYFAREFSQHEAGFMSSIGGVIASVSDREYAEEELVDKKKKVQHLLQNILPKGVIRDLKRDGNSVVASKFDSVSILFADMVGFTEMSSTMDAPDLVHLLNDIFSAFDVLTEKLGLEKIKTIGDAYMVAGGVPIASDAVVHCKAVAEMALGIIDTMQDYGRRHNRKLSVRVGFHTGSVVAGVIGLKKFAYDLWGDTVNVASRMESSGIAGRIHVSSQVEELLRDYYDFEACAEMPIKGKGMMKTFFLIGRKDAAATAALASIPTPSPSEPPSETN